MLSGGYDHGNPIPKLVQRGFQTTTNGGSTIIPLDNLPLEDGGEPLAVLGFHVVFPVAAITIPTGKHLDAVSMSQLVQLLTIQLAAGSPPSAYYGGDRLIDNIDGYTATMMLEYMSGVKVWEGNQAPVRALPAATASVTTATGVMEACLSNMRKGWPHAVASSFGSANGGPASWSDNPRAFFPIGIRDGEDFVQTAIPAAWFNGRARDGSTTGQGGQLIFQLAPSASGTPVDGIAVTWSNATTDVWALCVRVPRERQVVPLTPRLIRYNSGDKLQRSRPGIRIFLGMMKQLSAAGAMQSHNATRVHVTCDGRQLTEDDTDVQMSNLGYQCKREEYRIARTELALGTNLNAARLARFAIPFLAHDGSLLRRAGSVTEPTLVDFVTTTETTMPLVDFTLTPITPAVEELAKAWAPVPATSVESSTENGNTVPAHTKQILPGRTVMRIPAQAASGAPKGPPGGAAGRLPTQK